MKYIPLLWARIARKPIRTIFTMLSVVIAFLLYGILQGASTSFSLGVGGQQLDRLYIFNGASASEPLPLGYLGQLKGVDGVVNAIPVVWFGGYFRDTKTPVFAFATDVAEWATVFPENKLPPDQLSAIANTKAGAIIGAGLAKKLKWKVGDHVTLKSRFWRQKTGEFDWPFDIVGVFTSDNPGQNNGFFFHYSYLDDARSLSNGTVGWFVTRISDPTLATDVSERIDARFANSSAETKTQTEKEYTASLLRQVGDIGLMVNAILGAVFFTLLFLTAHTMTQASRERSREVATLRALGFSGITLISLEFFEAIVLCVGAAVVGLMLAAGIFPAFKGVIGANALPAIVLVKGTLIGIVLALGVSLPSAIRVGDGRSVASTLTQQ